MQFGASGQLVSVPTVGADRLGGRGGLWILAPSLGSRLDPKAPDFLEGDPSLFFTWKTSLVK